MIELVWKGAACPQHEDTVREELRSLIDGGLARPDDLIAHNVFLGDPETDPFIFVYGEDGKFHAEYVEKPEWITISDFGPER